MNDDWTYLRNELDRLDGSKMTFGTFAGWRVEAVPREYLAWCFRSVPLRAELQRAIRKVLSWPGPQWQAGLARLPLWPVRSGGPSSP